MPSLSPDLRSYFRLSQTATYGFLAALPLLLGYELLIQLLQAGEAAQIRIGAEIWMKQLLATVGASGRLIFAGVVLVAGFGIIFYERRKNIRIEPRYFVWILIESSIYAVFFAIVISTFVAVLFLQALPVILPVAAAAPAAGEFWIQIALSLGAGFYEELVFRVILVSGLFWILSHVILRSGHAYLTAAVIAALIFSAIHYIGPFGDPFALYSFTFRFMFGLVLNALYVFRGFGIAAWTHALYNVMLVMLI